ncbi:hypothetical protein PF007_g13690 [Phytophthora fragariae]|uniref:Uncharacterized protein n=1 Tax=Phytophthora fragariae TaxID=53985 RepID=A0A6A3RYP7_9STRA|nr:hypothetical protein PF007_g13690 [Phytophthora fragariae]
MAKDAGHIDGSSEGPASPSSLLGASSSGAKRKRDQDSRPINRASATSGKRTRKARSAKPTSNARMATRQAARRAGREASFPSNAGGGGVASGASGDNDCEAASVAGAIQDSDDSILTLDEVEEACKALQQMFDRQKGGKRQVERRRQAEKFKLSSSQIVLLANRYKAARNRGGQVDYEKASITRNFDNFTGHADKLEAYEGHVISMLKKALQQKRALDAGCRKKTKEEGTEELRLETAKFKLELRENKLSSKEEELEEKRVALQEQEQKNARSRLEAQRFTLDKEIKRHDEKATADKQAHVKDMMEQKAMLDEITKKKDALASHESLKKTADDWKQKCIRAENEAAAARVPHATLEILQDENRFMKKIVDSLDACCSTDRRIDDFAKHRVNDCTYLVL